MENKYMNHPIKNKVRRANSERIVNSANECNKLSERIRELEALLVRWKKRTQEPVGDDLVFTKGFDAGLREAISQLEAALK